MADKKLILVVDDEPDTVTYLTTFLEDNGYDTDFAYNGNEAVLKVQAKKPDLITLDMSMPEKSGVKFYREMKANTDTASIPIIVITGVTGFGGKSNDFQKFLSTRKQVPPPNAFIAKPVDRDNLLAEVKKQIG